MKTRLPFLVFFTAALAACGESGQSTLLIKETQRCEEQLSAIIDPETFSGLTERGETGRALALAARIRMEPSRKEALGARVRLIVTESSCTAYDRAGNPLGKYTMVLSTDKLTWWERSDDSSRPGLVEMAQEFDRKGAPLKAKRRFQLTHRLDKHEIEQTWYNASDEGETRTFASYEHSPETGTITITTKNRILDYADDGRVMRSVYCYEFDGPYCGDSKTWDYHYFQYDEAGQLIGGNGTDEGVDYEFKQESMLNDRGDVIRYRTADLIIGGAASEWTDERRILYYD